MLPFFERDVCVFCAEVKKKMCLLWKRKWKNAKNCVATLTYAI